jgi:membrane fusion protein, heavy metal efflux system
MKHFTTVLAVAIALAGCSSKTAAPPSETARGTSGAPTAQAGGSIVVLDEEAQKSAGVRVETIVERSIPEVIRASARLTNDDNLTWRVGAITEGRVVQVLAGPGDYVEQGRPLARIHTHDVHDSRAEFRKANTELARAKAGYEFAQKTRDRALRLYELKAGSLEQVERAETDLRNAEAALTTARTELDRARSHLVEFLGVPAEGDDDHRQGRDAAERDLVPILSPASGTVLTRNVTQGTVVTSANDLFVVSDLSSLWAVAEVSEEYLPKLKTGMPVRVYVQAWTDHAFPGRIGKIGESLDPATRTVKVRVNLPNPAGRLKPEMYATAEIEIGGSESAVFVPQEATQEVRGQTVVFIRTAPGRFEARPVVSGRILGGEVEIRRGVKSGESAATRGAFILKSEYLKSALDGE